MLPVLQVGPLAIQTPGLILLIGIWIGSSLAERFAPRRGISAAALYNLIFIALAAGLLGGRIAYAFRFPEAFAQSPISLLSLNPGLFSLEDGILIGLLSAWVYSHRKGMKLWETLDALTPALAVMMVAVGLAHLASGAAFGQETSLPWGIELWGRTRHPSQVYETLAALLILALLWPDRKPVQGWQPGKYFLVFLCLSAFARLFLEAFRGDSALLPGGFRTAQMVSWWILGAGLIALSRLTKSAARELPPPDPDLR